MPIYRVTRVLSQADEQQCAAANMGSVKLLQKSGFTLEQRLNANTKINGVLVDDLLYGLHSVDINPAKGS